MKLFAASDIHGDIGAVKKLAEKASKGDADIVLLLGDLVNPDNETEGLIGPFKEKGLDVAIIPGNHEGLVTTYFLAEKYKLKHLHGRYLKIGDVGIFGCGYANIGIHQLTDNEFFSTLKEGFDKIKGLKKKIMVTHLHPTGSIIEKLSFSGGEGISKALREFRPDIHLCGHIHEAEGLEEEVEGVKVVNIGKEGKMIEL